MILRKWERVFLAWKQAFRLNIAGGLSEGQRATSFLQEVNAAWKSPKWPEFPTKFPGEIERNISEKRQQQQQQRFVLRVLVLFLLNPLV